MPSFWERQAEERRRQSLAAQAARYEGQASQLGRVGAAVGREVSSGRLLTGDTVESLAAGRRRAEVAEAARVAEARRAQAEAQANLAQSRREAEARRAAESLVPQQDLFGTSQPALSDLEYFARRQDVLAEQEAMAPFWREVAYGPERESVGGGEASETERFLRDWGLSEQEIRLGLERFGEGRVVSGAGWLGLGALGLGANVGDLRRFASRAVGASRLLPAAGDVARGVGAAADVGQAARGKNIVEDIVQEKRQFLDLQPTLPADQLNAIPANQRALREIIHRQGFDAPTKKIDSSEFNRLSNSDEYDVVYRGVFGEEGGQAAALRFAEDMVDGNMFVGQGRFGDGVYLAMSPEYSLSYAAGAGRAPGNGAIVRFLVPRDARFVEYPIPPELVRNFETSGMRTMSEFLAASGYDGVRVPRSVGEGEMVLFNRSNLLTDGAKAVPEDVTYLLNQPDRWQDAINMVFR